MQRSRRLITAALLVLSLSVVGWRWGYSGDGEFETIGFWPLTVFKLQLPPFKFESGASAEYSLRGYRSTGRSWLHLELEGELPTDFSEVDAVVEVKILDEMGTTYFYRKGPLNQHFERMSDTGKTDWPLETEWAGRYKFGDPDFDNRAVPFKPNSVPLLSKGMTYAHSFPSSSKTLRLLLRIEGVRTQYENLTGSILVRSGGK